MDSVIADARTMQIASVRAGQPWICTVYFVLHKGSFYWLSFPERRHSSELTDNPKAAIAIQLKTDVPVTGLQAEGVASVVDNLEEVDTVSAAYVEKYGQGKRFAEKFRAGENRHHLYRFAPRKVMVFDENSYPDAPYQEIMLGK